MFSMWEVGASVGLGVLEASHGRACAGGRGAYEDFQMGEVSTL